MSEGKLDRPMALAAGKLASKGGLSIGVSEEKAVIGFLDESKDQLSSENSIPLSPQWLYAKPNESKDARLPSSLPHGILLDSAQKDVRPLEESQDKKVWRTNLLDGESNHCWREEERETSLLGRRERKKDGDRETEYRKNDRRSDNSSMKDGGDSRAVLSSERRNEGLNRNEGRRDSKWSSRWGPDDKEKESRSEKKMDGEKDDSLVEKQSLFGSLRPLSESDTRDKWRPRHRQEVHSGVSATYRAAPGFGLGRGCADPSDRGFKPGRGKPDSNTASSFKGFSAVPIGAQRLGRIESKNGASGLCADNFRYPRGKLLDIYRKQKTLPVDSNFEDLEDVPPVTLSSSSMPLAFVAPVADEEAHLNDIWKGMITSSEISKPGRNQPTRVDKYEIESGSNIGENKAEFNALISGSVHDSLPAVTSENDAFNDEKMLLCGLINSTEFGEPIMLKDDMHVGHLVKSEGMESPTFDISAKLPDDSNSLFDMPFIDVTSAPTVLSQVTDVARLSQHGISPEELTLFYQDPQGRIQGPFLGADIISWFEEGYFGADLPVCLADAPDGTSFQPLGELMPHLISKTQSVPVASASERSERLDSGKPDALVPASDMSGSFAPSGQSSLPPGPWDALNYPIQPLNDEHNASINTRDGWIATSDITKPLVFSECQEQSFQDSTGQDTNEVLYGGRTKSSMDKVQAKVVDAHTDSSWPAQNPQFALSDTGEGSLPKPEVLRENELSPLGLFWSELEGVHPKQHPLSSNIIRVSDQQITKKTAAPNDMPVFSHRGELHLNLTDESPIVREEWPSNYASRMPRMEVESNHFNLEQLFAEQLQRQQLQQQLLAHHKADSVHQRHAMNPHVPDLDHLLKFQFELEQQRNLQRMQQHQLHQHRRQQIQQQQMQLLQQQRQRQQLLLEQLSRQRVHGPDFGGLPVDPNRANNLLDQALRREQILNELQQQSQHIQRQHDATIEQLIQAKFGHQNDMLDILSRSNNRQMLPLEQQLLLGVNQQDQLQARQLAIALRQQTGFEEERHTGGIWPGDVSDQFNRAGPSMHQAHSLRHSHFDRNLALHEQLHRGVQGIHNLERSASMNAAAPSPNTDLANALARLQGLNQLEQHGDAYSSGQMALFGSGVRTHHHRNSEQYAGSLMGALDRQWPEPGPLSNSLIEPHFSQLQIEAEKHRRDMKMNFPIDNPNAWASQGGNRENVEQELGDIMYRKLALQPQQSPGMADDAPLFLGCKDSSLLFPHPTVDNSIEPSVDRICTGNSLENPLFTKVGRASQEGLLNARLENEPTSLDKIRKEHFEAIVGDRSLDGLEFTDVNEGRKGMKHGFKDNMVGRSFLGSLEGEVEALGRDQEPKGTAPVRHVSGGSTGGDAMFGDYEFGDDIAFSEEMVTNRSHGGIPKGHSYSLLKRVHDQHAATSQTALTGPTSAQSIKGMNVTTITSFNGSKQEPGVSSVALGSEPSVLIKRDASLPCVPSSADTDLSGPSFIDMLRSTKRPVLQSDASSSAQEPSEAGAIGKSSKKKGKKGKQIDPSLLGFKVHSNRIMMGEIQRPDD